MFLRPPSNRPVGFSHTFGLPESLLLHLNPCFMLFHEHVLASAHDFNHWLQVLIAIYEHSSILMNYKKNDQV